MVMKIVKTLIVSIGIGLSCIPSQAQYIPGAIEYADLAHLFSNYQFMGTARLQGTGGAQVSLGGDLSLALSNPAGLGFYNRSEISFSPTYAMKSGNAAYLGTQTNSSLNNFYLGNFGAVFNKNRDDFVPGAWRGGSFAISYTRLNDFNNQLLYRGDNRQNDILDFYVTDANLQDVDPNDLQGFTRGAYNLYLLSEYADIYADGENRLFYDRTFFAEFPDSNNPTTQQEVIDTKGGQNQWTFAYGGNFSDKIYVGASLGIMTLNYEVTKLYTETYPSLQQDIMRSSSVYESLLVEGTGINGAFGIIGRPINKVTLGLSVVTPTSINLSERYINQMEAQYNNFNMGNFDQYFDANYDIILNSRPQDVEEVGFFESSNPPVLDDEFTGDIEPSLLEYKVTTPVRVNAGATYFFNKNGFITADIEWVDYSKSGLRGEGTSLAAQDEDISRIYEAVINYRVGAEWRLKKFRLRAGAAYLPDPYADSASESRDRLNITGGLGYRSSAFYADLAFVHTSTSSEYAPYIFDPAVEGSAEYLNTNYATLDQSRVNMTLTLGLFF
jgi:hypothetical protein